MRHTSCRIRAVVGILTLLGLLPTVAQGQFPTLPPTESEEPRALPPAFQPETAATTAPSPSPERKVAIDPVLVNLRRMRDSWQLWADRTLVRDFGNAESEAREALRVVRELKANEWVTIGNPKPVVEYGLRDGRAPAGSAVARFALPIDLKSVRTEFLKGVWVVRDEQILHFNFGPNQADAEQAVAAVQKYGFDRVGFVGHPSPVMAYLFVAPPGEQPVKIGLGPLGQQAQIEAMTRTGIPVPGLGFVGEMIRIDPRNVEVRRDRYEWVLAHGTDVLARFGAGEWQARDALKVVQDARFTEWCRFGQPGVSFFLCGGRAPTRVPFATMSRQFTPHDLAAKQLNGKWWVTSASRPVFEVASRAEGEDVIRILKHFEFNLLCQTGNSPRASLSFLAKNR